MPPDVMKRNNVVAFGRGTQPMLFAHGFGCDQTMWRLVTPAFEGDYRVVLFDYAGHGRSKRAAYDVGRYATLDGFAQDLLDVVRALDLRDVILVGHSVSSIIGVLAVNAEPERFDRVVMVGPSPRYIDDPPDYRGGFAQADIEGLLDTMERNYIGWASAMAPIVAGNADRPELAGELNESFCSTDPVVARQFARATFLGDNRADLARLSVPALVLQCTDDAIAPQSVGEFVAATVPMATYRQLAATGHCPHMSHPDETIAAIRDYLGDGSPA